MITFEGYIKSDKKMNKIADNEDAKKIFDYLCLPKCVYNMIIFSKIGLPAITGIAKELEDLYGNSKTFPLSNDRSKQVIGKMISYILSFYGYSPVVVKSNEKRLRKFVGARYFKSSSVYQKTHKASLIIKLEIEEQKN